MSSLIDQALAIALEAHRDQRDRNGAPYILHPLRVMGYVEGEADQVTAILHDVVEDSDIGLDDLRRAGFGEEIVHAVDCLTRRDTESYEESIERAAADPLARRVKLADLRDHLDLQRSHQVRAEDIDRFNRYLAAWQRLQAER